MQEKIKFIRKWLGSGSINIFGLPMSGKDTQGARLAEVLGGVLIGGGAIMRGDDMPDQIIKAMKTGKLIKTSDYLSIIRPHLSTEDYQNKPLVLNSVGRWSGEEDSIIATLTEHNHPLKVVVFMNLDDKEIFNRLQISSLVKDRGPRGDDSKTKLEIRVKEFNSKTIPVVDFYRQLGVVVDIDASLKRDEVFESIIDELYKFANHASASR